jgi:hypothetical protein
MKRGMLIQPITINPTQNDLTVSKGITTEISTPTAVIVIIINDLPPEGRGQIADTSNQSEDRSKVLRQILRQGHNWLIS